MISSKFVPIVANTVTYASLNLTVFVDENDQHLISDPSTSENRLILVNLTDMILFHKGISYRITGRYKTTSKDWIYHCKPQGFSSEQARK